jgi:uncharacterized membrane protein YeaQ/YmgE (transglycosylase-associated protein family)
MRVNTETGTSGATEETDMIGNIISSIVIGAVLGALARFILPGKQNISVPTTIIAGMAAAFVGWAIAAIFGFNDTKGIDWWERILQVVLALIAVTIAAQRFPAKSRTTTNSTGTGTGAGTGTPPSTSM